MSGMRLSYERSEKKRRPDARLLGHVVRLSKTERPKTVKSPLSAMPQKMEIHQGRRVPIFNAAAVIL